MGYVFYYVEAHLACILLLCLIQFKIRKNVNKQLSQIYLGKLVTVLSLYFLAEIFWSLVDGGVITSSKSMLYISNIFTYVLISIAAYLWFILSEIIQNAKNINKDTTRLALSIPTWISSILCISAYRTGLVFYVDENGVLQNGRFYVVLIIVPFGYIIASTAKAIYRGVNKEKYTDRNVYIMIGAFPIFPFVLGVAQTIYWRVPLLCYGAVAAVYYMYITMLDNLISLDPLTQINNRNQMYKHLIQKMKSNDSGLSLFLMIVDVDKLKYINDNYGRREGDRAIVKVADAIKDVCQGPRNRFFVARYGGDEFVVVAEMAYKAEATWLSEQIRNSVKRISSEDELGYDLSVSVGVAQYDYDSPISIQSFIARADSDLYKQKKMNVM